MAMKPVVNRLEEEYKGRVEFRALNIDEASSQDAMKQYKFIGQPQFVVVGTGDSVLSSRNGAQTYESLKQDIEAALAAKP
jgi:thiol-disulfide isomerase/thioredoxin